MKGEHDRIERTSLILAETALSFASLADIAFFLSIIYGHMGVFDEFFDATISVVLFREVIVNLWIIAVVIGIVSISIMPRPNKHDRWWKQATWYLMPFVIIIHGANTILWCIITDMIMISDKDDEQNPKSSIGPALPGTT